MSITSALSNALSGLTASARSADVVSANLSNVLTEGYGRRDVVLSPQTETGGVRFVGVSRNVDTRILSDRRMADAGSSHAQLRSGFLAALETQIGLPDAPHSLSGRVAALEASLVTAASAPQEEARLAAAVDAAGQVARSFRAASERIEILRTEADTGIASAVEVVNSALRQIARLNADIVATDVSGRSTAALDGHAGTPTSTVQLFPGRGSSQPHNFSAEKRGVLGQGHSQILLIERIGIQHQFLR